MRFQTEDFTVVVKTAVVSSTKISCGFMQETQYFSKIKTSSSLKLKAAQQF